MLKRLLRNYPLLKLLLFFHTMVITALAALYYMRADAMLWGSILSVPVVKDADGNWLYQRIAGGPFAMLPWKLLPQHVLWVALDVLIAGSLTIWLSWWRVGHELRRQVAGREKAAADKLQEAAQQCAAAGSRMQKAEAWEQRLKALESRLETRESEMVNRELEAQAHMEGKDAEVKKMNQALTRLKEENRGLRKQLRGGS
ncbi:MAG: hypothetical protein OXP66_11720 [Candidatus Tectomicrobia bacterium]|nr:hypothetical protein [Candidatus Tectomicrobia bacterium]